MQGVPEEEGLFGAQEEIGGVGGILAPVPDEVRGAADGVGHLGDEVTAVTESRVGSTAVAGNRAVRETGAGIGAVPETGTAAGATVGGTSGAGVTAGAAGRRATGVVVEGGRGARRHMCRAGRPVG